MNNLLNPTLCALLIATASSYAAPIRMTAHRDTCGRLTTVGYQSESQFTATVLARDPNGSVTNRLVYGPEDDSDSDTLSDGAELFYFGHLAETATGDPDTDGLVNSNELALAADPTQVDTDADQQSDLEEYIAGTGLNDATDFFRVEALPQNTGEPPLLRWSARSNRTYQTQYSTNLLEKVWTDYGSPQAPLSDSTLYSSPCPATGAPCRIIVHLSE